MPENTCFSKPSTSTFRNVISGLSFACSSSTAFNVVTGILIFVNSNPLARCDAAIFGLSVESPETLTIEVLKAATPGRPVIEGVDGAALPHRHFMTLAELRG